MTLCSGEENNNSIDSTTETSQIPTKSLGNDESPTNTCIQSCDQAQSSLLKLDAEIVEGSAFQAENGSGNVVITPTGVSKVSSIDDITTCTTSSDVSTPMESNTTTKRPRMEESLEKMDPCIEPAIKNQNLGSGSELGPKSETQIQSSFAHSQNVNSMQVPTSLNGNIVFKRLDIGEDGSEIDNRTESNTTEVFPTSDTSKSTTASTSPLNQHQGCKDESSSSLCLGPKQPLLSSKLFEELVQLVTTSPATDTDNLTSTSAPQFTQIDNGGLHQSLQNLGLLIGGGLGVPQLRPPTGSSVPKESQSPTSATHLIGGGGDSVTADIQAPASMLSMAPISAVPSSSASPLTPPVNLSGGGAGNQSSGVAPSQNSAQPQPLTQNQLISQLLSNPLFQSQAFAGQSSQNLNRMVSAAFGVGPPQATPAPFGWPHTTSAPGQGFTHPTGQAGMANFAALLAAANSQLHGHTAFPMAFPTPVNRTISGGSNPILLPMQSATPSDGSAFEGTQASTTASTAPSEAGVSTSAIGQQSDPLLRLGCGLGHGSAGAPCIPQFWHANPNLLSSVSSLVGSGDVSQTMALLNAGSLNLQSLVQAPQAANNQASVSEEEAPARIQQNCLSLLASLQPGFDFSSLSTSSPAALAALASAAASAQLSQSSQIQDSENAAVKPPSKPLGVGRAQHGGGSRALNASSSVTAAAAALDHLDVDWDSVGLREAELAAMEICKTASTLFDTTDGTTPVPSSPAAVGEAVLTAAQLTISARAMLKFVKGLTPTQLGINWHACTQRFCVTYTTRDEQNPRSWTLGAYSNGKLHYKYFGPRSWTVMGLKEALRKAFKARTSLLLGQGIIEEPEDTGLSKEELTYHARQLLQQLRDSLGVKKGNVHKGLYISWHPKTRRFVVALKSCESGKTIYKYFSPKERSIKGIKTALLDAHQMVVAACQ
ncbi:hypothetical protein HWI79_333 [Cryptosporidium felis]|nr:hypothetical protein HWI79_333 [Cryptosporidium felis]